MTRVGWIGLGAMGAPMAAVAAVDHDIVAFDINPSAAVALADRGVTAASSVAEAAAGAEVLAVMVATEAQAEAVLFGESGAMAHLRRGSVVLVMATVGPDPVQRWAGVLAERGVGLVDAPVSGGVARAGAGDLLIMASGASGDVARVASLLRALARSAPVVGPVAGDGQKFKLVNQLLCGVHIAAAGEALALAGSLGLDPRECWEVIRHGAAASFMLDDRGQRMLDGDFDEVRSAIDIFVKDLGLVTSAGRAASAWTPMAETAESLFRGAHDFGLGRKDDSAMVSFIRDAG